jgi:hypothetical protein
MKNKWLKFKKNFHEYMCSLEDRGRFDPLYILYLVFEVTRILFFLTMVYYLYTLVKNFSVWWMR